MRKVKLCYHFVFERFSVRQLISYWIMSIDVDTIICMECGENIK